ncbi:hypothetical protein F471_00429 [Pseudomonas sp. URMO17WK12:I1]|uniref:hypothetical protein n=1 Tax=unclassified Pseudomonas TaxID=196821 RepID=UPI00048A29E7|nr:MULTISPECIES: hypothetical protein [unclassified Pseudomonas]PZW71358.1 hypothetical protein F471_00429 [Pseudomonas sp. URMO17WK12:I1]
MELIFTATTLAMVGAIYFVFQHLRSPSAQCRKQITDWLARFESASQIEQHEMADVLLRQSAELASQMGVEVYLDELLEASEPIELIRTWQAQLPIAIPSHALPKTPARTIGALLLIRDVQPESFRELLGQAVAT